MLFDAFADLQKSANLLVGEDTLVALLLGDGAFDGLSVFTPNAHHLLVGDGHLVDGLRLAVDNVVVGRDCAGDDRFTQPPRGLDDGCRATGRGMAVT